MPPSALANEPAQKVALVRPSWEFPASPDEHYIHNRVFAPLSLALTAAMLRQRGIQVRIVDAHALRLPPLAVVDLVHDCDKVFVTSSSLDRWECPNTNVEPFLICGRALEQAGHELYLLGVHPTVRPRQMLQGVAARAAVLGEPEQAVVEIAAGTSLDQVAGLGLLHDGQLVQTEPREQLLDLNDLPLPALDLLPMDLYQHVIMGPRSVLLEGSRGCPHRCTTCLQAMFGPRYRRKSGQTLIREVQFAVEQHGAHNITYIDMEFCLNRKPVEQLCEFLIDKRYDLQWCCSTRADAVDADLLRKMKAAGCSLIHFGVESGDQRMLDHINKRLDIDRVRQAVRLAQEAGIEALAFFMFGLPGETWEQMKQTRRFARRLAPDYISYHIFTPYPGTAAFEELGSPEEPLFPVQSGQYEPRELDRFVKRALLSFYLRPSWALRYARNVWRRGILRQARLMLNYMR